MNEYIPSLIISLASSCVVLIGDYYITFYNHYKAIKRKLNYSLQYINGNIQSEFTDISKVKLDIEGLYDYILPICIISYLMHISIKKLINWMNNYFIPIINNHDLNTREILIQLAREKLEKL